LWLRRGKFVAASVVPLSQSQRVEAEVEVKVEVKVEAATALRASMPARCSQAGQTLTSEGLYWRGFGENALLVRDRLLRG
jgi:hypothetical protein